jgi:Smg protein
MKEESVLNVLMYLFHNYMQDNCFVDLKEEQLFNELEEVGFERNTINQAFDWLANLALEIQSPSNDNTSVLPVRIYTPQECRFINTECRGFILSLEQQGILNPITRELIINQALGLHEEGIDLSLMKWVTLMVLFNQPDQEEALACMELLVLDDASGGTH